MKRILTFTCLLACLLLVAGCGSDSKKGSSAKKDKPTKVKVDPRKGYFHKEQSDQLNPYLTRHNAGMEKFNGTKAVTACNALSDRLYIAGKYAQSAKCYVAQSKGVIASILILKNGFASIDPAPYNADCQAQLKAVDAFAAQWIKQWQIVLGERQAYIAGNYKKSEKVAVDEPKAQRMQSVFNESKIQALSNACYIKADLDEAAKTAKDAAKKAKAADTAKVTS